MIKPIVSFFKEYDSLANHPLQSWQWGEAKTALGLSVIRFGEYNQESKSFSSVFQMSIHRLKPSAYAIGYLPRSSLPSLSVLSFLNKLAKKHRLIFIKIEPYVTAQSSRFLIDQIKNKLSNLTTSPHPLFPSWTQIIDLTKTEEELLSRMHYKTRYNIRLAKKKGVAVKEMSDKTGFEIFLRLYLDTCRRQQYFGHNRLYHQVLWQYLQKKIARILIAFYQNIPLSAYELFVWKDTGYYPYGGSSMQHRNLMASTLLMWETIRFLKNLGLKRFDLWGSLPPNFSSAHRWAGFTRFKQGFGGDFVHLADSYDLITNLPVYRIYNHLYNLRQFYLNIVRRFF